MFIFWSRRWKANWKTFQVWKHHWCHHCVCTGNFEEYLLCSKKQNWNKLLRIRHIKLLYSANKFMQRKCKGHKGARKNCWAAMGMDNNLCAWPTQPKGVCAILPAVPACGQPLPPRFLSEGPSENSPLTVCLSLEGGRRAGGGLRGRVLWRSCVRALAPLLPLFPPPLPACLPACVCCIAAATGPPLVLPESPTPTTTTTSLSSGSQRARSQGPNQNPASCCT